MEHMENQIVIRGQLQQLPEVSHENHGKTFLKFCLAVERLSGTIDEIPVIAPKTLVDSLDPSAGDMIYVEGQVRSYNQKAQDGRHLQIFVFAAVLKSEDGEPYNQLSITGNLCREPILRRTPLGREICDVMLAVPRAFHRADYLPCILWGRTAQEAACCRTGDQISIEGRLQSRCYSKVTDAGTFLRTTYEISAMTADIPVDLY